MGIHSMNDNTTGSYNNAIGFSALRKNTTANYNTAIGHEALRFSTTAERNTMIGAGTGYDITTGSNNTAVGYRALYNVTTGALNTAIGDQAGQALTTGSNNSFYGDNSGELITTGSNNTIIGRFDGNSNSLDIRTLSNRVVISDGSGTPYMHFNSAGRATIGSNSEGSGGYSTILTLRYAGGGTEYGLNFLPDANGAQACSFFNAAGTNVGSIGLTASATSYNTSSDHRLKENVVELTGATTRLKQLAPKRFNFIADADTTVDGFLAHEVQTVVPEAISGTHNEVDADGNPVYQGIDQSKLVPLLVATIKELEARITALENE